MRVGWQSRNAWEVVCSVKYCYLNLTRSFSFESSVQNSVAMLIKLFASAIWRLIRFAFSCVRRLIILRYRSTACFSHLFGKHHRLRRLLALLVTSSFAHYTVEEVTYYAVRSLFFFFRFAKNKAIEQSSGEFLCFLDSDDVIAPRRLEAQLAEARKKKENGCDAATHGPQHVLVGSRFHRIPEASTARYTQWANTLPQHLLDVQVMSKKMQEMPYLDAKSTLQWILLISFMNWS